MAKQAHNLDLSLVNKRSEETRIISRQKLVGLITFWAGY